MEFKDIFESVLVELVETPEDKQFLSRVKFKWGKSDEWNNNKRFYPDLVATSAIKTFNNESQKGVGIVGQLDHPIGTSGTLLSNASHLITKVWKDDSKVWWAEAKVMRTSKGRDLLAVLKTKTKIGASLRGFGEVGSDGKVKPGLEIRAIDFVSSPSFGASATVDQGNVFESFVPEYEFTEDDLQEITSAMDELKDETIAAIQEKLAKEENIEMTAGKVKALSLWIRLQKDNPNIPPFHKWFDEQQKLFAQNDPNRRQAINEELYRQSRIREEKNIAGFSGDRNANLLYSSRKRIEARQREIDEALEGKTMSNKTISRLFAEACLAGYKGSRADWIREFGF